MERNFFWELR